MLEERKALEFLSALTRSQRRLTREEMERLYILARHDSPIIRGDVAALLIDHYEEKSEQVLLELTGDAHPLVRTNAADSLCIGRTEAAFHRLIELARYDTVYTVRGCAVRSAYDVLLNRFGDSDRILEQLAALYEPLVQREADLWVCTCYYGVLHLCGKRDYLHLLIACLDDDDDYVRNSVLDILGSILDERNRTQIEQAIQEHLPLELNEMLMDKAEELLSLLQEMGENGDWGRKPSSFIW